LGTRGKLGLDLDSRKQAILAAKTAVAKKGHHPIILDVRQVTLLADYFVIVGGDSQTQVRAIADAIDQAFTDLGAKPHSVEGKAEGRWVLLDFGSIIVHVLHEKERNYYRLEQFWNQALIVDTKEWSEELTLDSPINKYH
jgi:ribosome-associated protein